MPGGGGSVWPKKFSEPQSCEENFLGLLEGPSGDMLPDPLENF